MTSAQSPFTEIESPSLGGSRRRTSSRSNTARRPPHGRGHAKPVKHGGGAKVTARNAGLRSHQISTSAIWNSCASGKCYDVVDNLREGGKRMHDAYAKDALDESMVGSIQEV